MRLPTLIYLDTEFITQNYEALKGGRVPTKVVKKSNVSGKMSVFLLGAGATMEEVKEYSLSSRMMYEKIHDHFEKLPKVNFEKGTELPEMFWAQGILSCTHSTVERGSGQIAATDVFVFEQSFAQMPNPFMKLITNDTYFVSGFDRLLQHGYALTCGFAIRVRLLVRLICIDAPNAIGAPMIIFKTGNLCGEKRTAK